jgi:uncharacterized protein (DUF1499 family)
MRGAAVGGVLPSCPAEERGPQPVKFASLRRRGADLALLPVGLGLHAVNIAEGVRQPLLARRRRMTEETAGPARRGWRDRIAGAALLLAALSLLALAASPLGWRAGWLPLMAAFGLLMLAAIAAVLGAVLAALALALARRRLGNLRILLLAGVLLLGAAFVLLPLRVGLSRAPVIHDITTDADNPPAIVAALPARAAEHAAPAAYGGPAIAAQQRAAYPDIAPVILALAPAKAFDLALATARAMPRWRITASDPAAGRIEASQASFWFGFVDDIVIRVAADGDGSRVDIRSLSRQGKGDLGVNAARVRAYIAALKTTARL